MFSVEKHIINIFIVSFSIMHKIAPDTEDTKYILVWSRNSEDPIAQFGVGQEAFIRNNCIFNDCYVTTDHNFFNGPLIRFDAILFSGINILREMTPDDFPKIRESDHKYVYVNQESPVNQPVCLQFYNNFFNWTMTFKLDSDIPIPYIAVLDKQYKTVGPRRNMRWLQSNYVSQKIVKALKRKKRAVAWFCSDCSSRSGREHYVKRLEKALKLYNLAVDIYGLCGPLNCSYMPSSYLPAWGRVYKEGSQCGIMLTKNYYFYLAFENAFAEDYVTEKVLWGLQFLTVPIVYGGANYSRFLPPNSYVDATKLKPRDLAALIHKNMFSIDEYKKYFTWMKHYRFKNPTKSSNICKLCAALHNQKKMETTSKVKFREWWSPGYKKSCENWFPALSSKMKRSVRRELWPYGGFYNDYHQPITKTPHQLNMMALDYKGFKKATVSVRDNCTS